jgi:hypothetical protein
MERVALAALDVTAHMLMGVYKMLFGFYKMLNLGLIGVK